MRRAPVWSSYLRSGVHEEIKELAQQLVYGTVVPCKAHPCCKLAHTHSLYPYYTNLPACVSCRNVPGSLWAENRVRVDLSEIDTALHSLCRNAISWSALSMASWGYVGPASKTLVYYIGKFLDDNPGTCR